MTEEIIFTEAEIAAQIAADRESFTRAEIAYARRSAEDATLQHSRGGPGPDTGSPVLAYAIERVDRLGLAHVRNVDRQLQREMRLEANRLGISLSRLIRVMWQTYQTFGWDKDIGDGF